MSVSMTSHWDVTAARNLRTLRFDHIMRPVIKAGGGEKLSDDRGWTIRIEQYSLVHRKLVVRDRMKNDRINGWRSLVKMAAVLWMSVYSKHAP